MRISSFQWFICNLAKNGAESNTSRLFLDTCTPAQVYQTGCPLSPNMRFRSLLTREVRRNFLQASSAIIMFSRHVSPTIDRAWERGSLMNGRTSSIRLYVNPIFGSGLSKISITGWLLGMVSLIRMQCHFTCILITMDEANMFGIELWQLSND